MSFQAIFDVSVALLRGCILHAAESERAGEGAWGVIKCDEALGAFDARSEAWCGRDGIPHRMSRAEAEERARRLSGSSYDGSAYSALEIPSRPLVVYAGRHGSATDCTLRFECVDWTNGPGDVVAVGTAFDAAGSFVALVGERMAYAAIADADSRQD